MTEPSTTPSKAKAWWAAIIPALGSLGGIALQLGGFIPAPWGAALTGIGLLISALTGATVHQTAYLPPGTAIVPAVPGSPQGGGYAHPWKD